MVICSTLIHIYIINNKLNLRNIRHQILRVLSAKMLKYSLHTFLLYCNKNRINSLHLLHIIYKIDDPLFVSNHRNCTELKIIIV